MFLDVQMPGLTGFEVARRLIQTDAPPQLVFVTAFDQYAIDAFAVNAVDYVLKPVDARRLEQTLDRARAPPRVPNRDAGLPLSPDDLERVIEAVQARQDAPRAAGDSRRRAVRPGAGRRGRPRLARRRGHRRGDPDASPARRTSGRSMSCRRGSIPAVFWRVHRSHLVNITKIKEIVPWFSRNYLLQMKDQKDDGNPGQPVPDQAAAGVPAAVKRGRAKSSSTPGPCPA